MAHKTNNIDLTELLLQCVTQPNPMLSMLELLCTQLMEAEVNQRWGEKRVNEQSVETVIAVDTLPAVWMPARERCISCFPRCGRAAISRSSSRSASAARLRSFR